MAASGNEQDGDIREDSDQPATTTKVQKKNLQLPTSSYLTSRAMYIRPAFLIYTPAVTSNAVGTES